MTNLVTSPEASMFEKPTATDITTGKKLTKAANATRDSLLIPSHTTNKAASAIFGINWSMTRLGWLPRECINRNDYVD
jgi:hypothetical protein